MSVIAVARVDEVEAEKVLDFAENLLLNTAGVWQLSGTEAAFGASPLPLGVEYAEGLYRTQETSFCSKV
jgi:hypothetical protein